MEKSYTVYMHTTPSGKRYIGITSRKPEHRWNNGAGYAYNKHFSNAISKYGWDNIAHTIIAKGLSKSAACEMEKALIKKYDTTNCKNGYNQSTGGECGSAGIPFTEERRRKIGEAHKGMKHTDEAKRLMSIGHKGRPSWNKGRHWTEEEKDKMQKAQSSIKQIVCVETGMIYYGVRDAERKTGVNHTSIRNCLHKRKHCKTAGGFHWEYVQE